MTTSTALTVISNRNIQARREAAGSAFLAGDTLGSMQIMIEVSQLEAQRNVSMQEIMRGDIVTVSRLSEKMREDYNLYFSPQEINHILITMGLQTREVISGETQCRYFITDAAIDLGVAVNFPIGEQRSVRWREGTTELIRNYLAGDWEV